MVLLLPLLARPTGAVCGDRYLPWLLLQLPLLWTAAPKQEAVMARTLPTQRQNSERSGEEHRLNSRSKGRHGPTRLQHHYHHYHCNHHDQTPPHTPRPLASAGTQCHQRCHVGARSAGGRTARSQSPAQWAAAAATAVAAAAAATAADTSLLLLLLPCYCCCRCCSLSVCCCCCCCYCCCRSCYMLCAHRRGRAPNLHANCGP